MPADYLSARQMSLQKPKAITRGAGFVKESPSSRLVSRGAGFVVESPPSRLDMRGAEFVEGSPPSRLDSPLK